MIRINLLGVQKAKGKRGSPTAVAAPMGEGGSILVKALAAMIAIAILNRGYWFVLDKQKRDIATQMAVAERKNRELSDAKARSMERQPEADNHKRPVDGLDQFPAGHNGPNHPVHH